jgi:hypothetical protein
MTDILQGEEYFFYNISILYYTFYYFFSYRSGFQEVFAKLLFRAVCSRTLCEYL